MCVGLNWDGCCLQFTAYDKLMQGRAPGGDARALLPSSQGVSRAILRFNDIGQFDSIKSTHIITAEYQSMIHPLLKFCSIIIPGLNGIAIEQPSLERIHSL